MKKLSVIALAASVGALIQPAAAESYVRGDIGYSVGGGADISADAPIRRRRFAGGQHFRFSRRRLRNRQWLAH